MPFDHTGKAPFITHFESIAETILDLHANLEKIFSVYLAIDPASENKEKLLQIYNQQKKFLQSVTRDLEQLEKENHILWKSNLIDELTGLLSKKSIFSIISRHLETEDDRRKEKGTSSGCLLIMNINSMKILNETYGHLTTDTILQKFTKIIKSYMRKNDHAFRFGGDEFVLYLPETDASSAARVLTKRILSHLYKNPIMAVPLNSHKHEIESEVKISFCLGAATLPNVIPDTNEKIKNIIEATLRIADELEITAKNYKNKLGFNITLIAFQENSGKIIIEDENDIFKK
jgi:diguanylate cyclase (GGDEF)-like protein